MLAKDDAQEILTNLHDGPVSGQYGGETMAHKVF